MMSPCSIGSDVLERRVSQLMCMYCAEVPIVRAFAECYTNSDYMKVWVLKLVFKVHLFHLVK